MPARPGCRSKRNVQHGLDRHDQVLDPALGVAAKHDAHRAEVVAEVEVEALAVVAVALVATMMKAVAGATAAVVPAILAELPTMMDRWNATGRGLSIFAPAGVAGQKKIPTICLSLHYRAVLPPNPRNLAGFAAISVGSALMSQPLPAQPFRQGHRHTIRRLSTMYQRHTFPRCLTRTTVVLGSGTAKATRKHWTSAMLTVRRTSKYVRSSTFSSEGRFCGTGLN